MKDKRVTQFRMKEKLKIEKAMEKAIRIDGNGHKHTEI